MFFAKNAEKVDNINRCWHALYTRHQHEKVIAGILSTKGFDVFLPLYTSVHSWKDRNKELRLPLFPCYVFLRGGLERRLDILATPGVCSFVGSNGRAAVIPSHEIDAVRRATETSQRIEPYPFLQHGERVRVKSGPFEGIEGILTLKKNVYRLVITVELLGKSAAVELDRSMVERVLTPATASRRSIPAPSAPSRDQEADILAGQSRGGRVSSPGLPGGNPTLGDFEDMDSIAGERLA